MLNEVLPAEASRLSLQRMPEGDWHAEVWEGPFTFRGHGADADLALNDALSRRKRLLNQGEGQEREVPDGQ